MRKAKKEGDEKEREEENPKGRLEKAVEVVFPTVYH